MSEIVGLKGAEECELGCPAAWQSCFPHNTSLRHAGGPLNAEGCLQTDSEYYWPHQPRNLVM